MTMKRPPTLLIAAAALALRTVSGDLSTTEEAVVDSCPLKSWSEVGVPIEHTDEVCNRAWENDPERMERVRLELVRSVSTGAARQLKDQQTWSCPSDDVVELNLEEAPVGPPSTWIFHNRATTPVVVSWVHPKTNVEVSAFHPDISPAHHDPKAVFQPGEWHTVSVYLGHVFHVRELVSVGGGQLAPGRILLRHRPGPVPIRNRYGGLDLAGNCPVQALADPEPKPPTEFKRAPFDYNRRCNSLFTAFANRMDCPVDVYYAGIDGDVASASPDASSSNNDKNETVSGNRKNACPDNERFSFHLGVNPSATEDYFDAWGSPVAFEATYLTHKFVARLRHARDVVVDEIVIDRTYVRDCPSRKQASAAADIADREGIMTGPEVHTKTDAAVVDANGEIELSDFESTAAFLQGAKNSTVASTVRNATDTVAAAVEAAPEEKANVVTPETTSASEANVATASG